MKRTAAAMLMSTFFTNDFTFAITFNFLIVNTFVVLKFLMQSYDALEQETTKSQFFVTVICGGNILFVTNKPPFAITVAAPSCLSTPSAMPWQCITKSAWHSMAL